jgi:hypothetical protein
VKSTHSEQDACYHACVALGRGVGRYDRAAGNELHIGVVRDGAGMPRPATKGVRAMSIAVTGVGLFMAAFLIHVAWWRLGRPRRSGQTLIVLMVAVISITWLVAFASALFWPAAACLLPGNLIAFVHALVVALAIAAAYVMTYPAIEVESPILVLIDTIAKGGRAGVEIKELRHRLDNDALVAPRIQDLLDEGLLVFDDGRYRPTAKGVALARMFAVWRRLIGAGEGG